MKSDYETRAKHFIRSFFSDFEMPEERNAKLRYCESYTRVYNLTHKRNIIFMHGYTRFAFITSDYVIKIDYFDSIFGGCADEVMVYSQAEKDNMAYLFAKITPYEFNGNVYYIMPRIDDIDEEREEEVDYYLSDAEYEYVFNKLGLSDLHCGNYGFRNGEVVIIDYACHN